MAAMVNIPIGRNASNAEMCMPKKYKTLNRIAIPEANLQALFMANFARSRAIISVSAFGMLYSTRSVARTAKGIIQA
jgi:hypothetical protein